MYAKYPKNPKYASLIASFAAVSTVTVLAASEQAAQSHDVPTAPAKTPVAAPAKTTPAASPAVAAKISLPQPQAVNNGAAHIAYRSPAFDRFIGDSYREAGLTQAQAKAWYGWMDGAYKHSGVRFAGKEKITALAPLMDSIGKEYVHAKSPAQKTQLEIKTGKFLHTMVKKSIPKFSLDRGSEFSQAMQKGERQCYLQSVLVSGLMQRAGMNVGVVMVSKSDKGEETNNGHCVALVKLSNGHDVLVDVSHPHPFVAQQGLMAADAKTGEFHYVAPQYDGEQIITGYQAQEGGAVVPAAQVRSLDYKYLVSQFDYYRGERAPGGFVASEKTPEGLAASAKYLEKSVKECPQNPLAQYVLGRVYLRQNRPQDAKVQVVAAYKLYEKAGWIPQGAKDALVLVKETPQTLSMR